MSSRLLPANSGLIGVALVVRSKEGPRFVFHYPPHIKEPFQELPRFGTELDPTTPNASDDEEDDDDLEEEDFGGFRKDFDSLQINDKKLHVKWDGDKHFETEDGEHVVPWEHVDAFKTSELASILTPNKAYHKKYFELSLDPVIYVTYPIHQRDDGTWKKAKRSKRDRRKKHSISDRAISPTARSVIDDSNSKSKGKEPVVQPPSGSSFNSDDGTEGSGITMFNLVFLMHPLPQERSTRVRDIFEHVAKDMNKALKFAQHYNNYVWKESELILNMKSQAKDERLPMSTLWKAILDKSTLAVALKDVFEAITNNNIATVNLASVPPIRLSVQIPKPWFLSALPSNHEKAMSGLWITTANCIGESQENDSNNLNKDFTLLLMDDESKIISDIQSDGGALAEPLLRYLKLLSPTLSFQQTSVQHSINLDDIRTLAQHLIFYRRAMAIPPLHGRDTYIMNPNSDNHKLPSASISWSQAFPLAPPLVTFLADISKSPKPYKLFAPSKSHRPVYIQMLAWLMRGGWVTQLRTFAWIIVWPEICYEVQYELDRTNLKKVYDEVVQDAVDEARAVASGEAEPEPTTAQTAEKARIQRSRAKVKQDWVDFQKRPKPVATAEPSMILGGPHIDRVHTTTIVDPAKPSHVDSLFLEAISKRFPDAHARKTWMKFAKYFNGKEALEMIALKEGMKRKEVMSLLVVFDEYLLMARHW